jgi:hypothetical protein
MHNPDNAIAQVPTLALAVVDWIFEKSEIGKDTLKHMLLSQHFPYVEDACLDYLRTTLGAPWNVSEETLEWLRRRIRSISSIRSIQLGFITKALAVLDSSQSPSNESV